MEVKILNVYNNEALPGQGFKSGHGESFLITAGSREVLFDTGWKGNILMQNIRALGIDVNAIDKVVLSHGHRDHTGGLPSLLEARIETTPLPVIAHPDALEPKWAKRLIFHFSMGLPSLRKERPKNGIPISEKSRGNPAKTLDQRRDCDCGKDGKTRHSSKLLPKLMESESGIRLSTMFRLFFKRKVV